MNGQRQRSVSRQRNRKSKTSSFAARPWLLAAALGPLFASCGVETHMEPYKQTDVVVSKGEQLVVLARKQHSNHEAEEGFVQCISDALAKGDSPPRGASDEGVRGQHVPVVRAFDGAAEHGRSFPAAREARGHAAGAQHRRPVRRLARRLDRSSRERRRHHVRGGNRRRGLHGLGVVGRRFALRRDDLGHQARPSPPERSTPTSKAAP